jgi:hypothetical protein
MDYECPRKAAHLFDRSPSLLQGTFRQRHDPTLSGHRIVAAHSNKTMNVDCLTAAFSCIADAPRRGKLGGNSALEFGPGPCHGI